jgi:hypothetical protein
MKFGEAYRLLQQSLPKVRQDASPTEVRPLFMAADWIHLKLLLYAIGNGPVMVENMRNLRNQWVSHIRVFGPPLGAFGTSSSCDKCPQLAKWQQGARVYAHSCLLPSHSLSWMDTMCATA